MFYKYTETKSTALVNLLKQVWERIGKSYHPPDHWTIPCIYIILFITLISYICEGKKTFRKKKYNIQQYKLFPPLLTKAVCVQVIFMFLFCLLSGASFYFIFNLQATYTKHTIWKQ